MANGWAPDGAVQEQIEGSLKDALASALARMASGAGLAECEECGEPIPEARRRVRAHASPASLCATCVRAIRASTGAAARTASCADGMPMNRLCLTAAAGLLACGWTAPALADPCEGPLPAKGTTFTGVVRYVGDGDGLCIGPAGQPNRWSEI
jgi:hypothetical protein